MQPGGSLKKFFRRTTVAGVAVTGKVTADFTFLGYYCAEGGSPTATTLGATVTELTSGWYMAALADPPVAAQWFIDIACASGTDLIQIPVYSGETESSDLDSLAASVARPLVSLTGAGTIGQTVNLTLTNKRYRVLTFSFEDENRDPIDMTTYGNITFGVRSKTDDTATPPKVDAVNGTPTAGGAYVITPGDGTVTVAIPEDATFFVLAESTAPDETLDLEYELTGDADDDATMTVPLVATSILTLTKRIVGT